MESTAGIIIIIIIIIEFYLLHTHFEYHVSLVIFGHIQTEDVDNVYLWRSLAFLHVSAAIRQMAAHSCACKDTVFSFGCR